MQRDLRRLADTTFDLVVVGAGFYGALAAWDATLRGLSVALIDKGDFGGATSFNNLKTLHGGLRSLQSLNYPQMRLFIRERRALARVAPHLVRPMPFVAPTYRHPLRAATTLRVALRLNDLVANDRSEGIDDPALHLPPSDVLSRDECLRLNPAIDPAGVTGGARWHDYQMRNADRMTLSFVVSAAEAGAATGNYVEATGAIRDDNRIAGVSARDVLTGDALTIRARTVLNAAGPWAASWLTGVVTAAHPPAAGLSRAMNVVTRQVPVAQACGGLASGRFLFLIPWRDVTLVGTSHDPYAGTPDQLSVTARDVDIFMKDVARSVPARRTQRHRCAVGPSRPAAEPGRPRTARQAAEREHRARSPPRRRGGVDLDVRRPLHDRAADCRDRDRCGIRRSRRRAAAVHDGGDAGRRRRHRLDRAPASPTPSVTKATRRAASSLAWR